MKQVMVILNKENLDNINSLLNEGFQLGNQYSIPGQDIVFVVLQKYVNMYAASGTITTTF